MLLLSMGDCMIEMSSEIHPAHMNLDWLLGLDLPVCFFLRWSNSMFLRSLMQQR